MGACSVQEELPLHKYHTHSYGEDRRGSGNTGPRYLPSMNPAPKDLATYPKQSGRCPERWLAQQSYCAD